MKTLWYVFLGLLLFNLLGAVGFVGWMYMDGRINKDRLQQMVDTFTLTIEEELEQDAENLRLTEESEQARDQIARMKSVAGGPTTLRERLDREQQADETVLQKIELFNAQNKALREEMTRFKANHAQRVAQLDKEREAFEQWVQQQAEQTRDDNFQQVVGLYETQPAKQTKQAFQTLMQQGQTHQVVEYLAAMSSRKAGKVLSQFKTPGEVAQAADLLEKLRTRGEYTPDEQTPSSGNQS